MFGVLGVSARYYVADGTKRGSLTGERLLELVRAGEIDPAALVWFPYLSKWQRVIDVQHLREVLPDRLRLEVIWPEPNMRSGPHARFVARAIDLAILVPAGVAIIVTTNTISGVWNQLGLWSIYARLLYLVVGQYAFLFLFIVLATSVSMALTNSSPGKLILGIKVRRLTDDAPLWFHFKREFRILAFVLCFGLPLPALLEMGRQHVRVRFDQSTTYDDNRAIVEGRPSTMRFVLALCVLPILASAIVGLLMVVRGAIAF